MNNAKFKMVVMAMGITAIVMGCGNDTSANDVVNVSGNNTGTSAVVSQNAGQMGTTAGALAEDEQLALIAANRDLWLDDVIPNCSYAVTDMDHNGRLEIIVTYCEGTGMYSTTTVYEVNANGSGLDQIPSCWEEGESQPDIGSCAIPTYYDAAEDTYLYVVEDICRVDASEAMNSMHAWSLKNGTMSDSVIATLEITSTDLDSEPKMSGKDCFGRTLTQEEYQASADDMYSGMEKTISNFYWLSGATEQLQSMDDEGVTSMLLGSYSGFAGGAPN